MDALNGVAARLAVETVGVALVCLVVYKRVAEKFITGCADSVPQRFWKEGFRISHNEQCIGRSKWILHRKLRYSTCCLMYDVILKLERDLSNSIYIQCTSISGLSSVGPPCTQKCIFMGREVREISRFFVAPPRAFPVSIWRGFTDFLNQKYIHLSIRHFHFNLMKYPRRIL